MRSLIVGEQGYVSQSNNGNFQVFRSDKKKGSLEGDVILNRSEFAKIFGRIPSTGVSLRADVFIRLCRMSNIILYFFDPEQGKPFVGEITEYSTTSPMIQAVNVEDDDFTPSYGLFLNDEGNFNLLPVSKMPKPSPITLPININKFESMFGLDIRDYFANEAIRIATLAGVPIRATIIK